MQRSPTRLVLAQPRGFCAGVDRAIEVVEKALEIVRPPVYVYHEIVHNAHVVRDLAGRGAIFVDGIEEVPRGATVVFSAHGISPRVRQDARERSLRVIDATCPLVLKVHLEAIRFAGEGRTILLVGHAGHDEVVGTMGEAPGRILLVQSRQDAESVQVRDPDRVAVITQTTLALDETREILVVLRRRFPTARFPAKDDICYATQNRQMAVKGIAAKADLVLVIGSENSSNSVRLVEVARSLGTAAYLIDDVTGIQPQWLAGVRVVGITAGASAPEALVQDVIAYFRGLGIEQVESLDGVKESVHFELPAEVYGRAAASGRACP